METIVSCIIGALIMSGDKSLIKEYTGAGSSRSWTPIDFAYLAVVAVISAIIFYAAWYVYDAAKAIGGPIFARMISYGLWFIGAPFAATLIKKPFSGFLGETLGALIESFIPTAGGFTNLVYGAVQGLMSEIIYAVTGWKRYDEKVAALAGAAAGPAAVALDAILFDAIATTGVVLAWIIAAVISGAIYGYIVARVVKAVA